ncbi:hypothetical protein [Priestia megaterium]|uniref:hypothetical protein n=1 Tax=Priestia megaterium TaxID=1404 RepID=UPI000BEC479B|nr:hypothetical protein [Priestia megaterium]MED4240629.1 hypothetical protein [Priestia megaterium]PEE43849.1 hypothetical protein COM71_24350 [Priestia megaterium]
MVGVNWESVLTSAITAIVFTGGTSYILQKKTRKGNEITAKGFILIDEIESINQKRHKATVPLLVDGFSTEQLEKCRIDYLKDLQKFESVVRKYSFLFDKKTNKELQDFISYLRELERELLNLIDDKVVSLNINNQKIDSLCKTIVSRIQKHM